MCKILKLEVHNNRNNCIIIGIIVVLLSFIVNVKAQDIIGKTFKKNVMCSTHEFVTNDLQKKHKQIRVWWATTSDNELIELFVNNIKGTWIIILSVVYRLIEREENVLM